ncbi:MAG: hypothetical protein ACR2J4_01810, partial [Deinococcus sp.]
MVAALQPGVLHLAELNAGDSSRASHVWRVDGPGGLWVARRPWWTTPEVSAFMSGLGGLFGVDPRDLGSVTEAYALWRELDAWAVPQTLGVRAVLGAPALGVEWVDGEGSRPLADADAGELGRRVAHVHARTRDTFGPLSGGQGWPLAAFYPRALAVLGDLTARFDAALWVGVWPQLRPMLEQAPAPSQAVPLLLDWSGGQFVWRDGQPFALVDVEASVFGPPELDLCSWEGALSPA